MYPEVQSAWCYQSKLQVLSHIHSTTYSMGIYIVYRVYSSSPQAYTRHASYPLRNQVTFPVIYLSQVFFTCPKNWACFCGMGFHREQGVSPAELTFSSGLLTLACLSSAYALLTVETQTKISPTQNQLQSRLKQTAILEQVKRGFLERH